MFPLCSPIRKNSPASLRIFACLCLISLGWLIIGATSGVEAQISLKPFKNFESPQVHPLALTPDGTRLLAVNSLSGTLSVFQLSGASPLLTAEIPVGLEPVSVAVRANNREAWVVNWLSDSVSVVDLTTGNVTRTIDVGDEPTDVLFAGLNRETAFVCVSGTSKVKVLDPDNLMGAAQTIDIFGKQPRALARSANGAQVFVSVFESGNQTTIVPETNVSANGGLPAPNPVMAAGLPAAPRTGLIVKWNGTTWVDEINRNWNGLVPYTLADIDLVVIDASAQTPSISAQVRGLGTNVGNMAFDATTSRLFVANLESSNQVRFEPNLKGRFQQSRVTVLNVVGGNSPTVASVNDLNAHVDFNNPAGTDAERAQSLALPSDIVHASDGTTYVAALSSARVGILSATGVVTGRISVGQGPTGLALDETRQRLYVLNRFDNTVGVVNTNTRTQVAQVSLGNDPEPADSHAGRRFLYDASLSAHGTVSCASCHLNAHRDGLSWDLGDPTGAMGSGPFGFSNVHPMKGPMTTQSLRGILSPTGSIGTEPLHWRGDRLSLSDFNPAFMSLLGGTRQLSGSEMTSFVAFVRTLTYPSNPNENSDRTFPNPATGASAARGSQLFQFQQFDAGAASCNACHTSFPGFRSGTNRLIVPGQLLQEPQDMKVPQLRGLYQKTGMVKAPGAQLAGYGFVHDGSMANMSEFLGTAVFRQQNGQPLTIAQKADLEAFIMSFDTGTAPSVGLQVTVNADNKNSSAVNDRINLLIAQSTGFTPNCNLIVRGIYGNASRGFLHIGGGVFQPDSSSEANVTLQQLLNAAGAGMELTFTGVPVDTGQRNALDRDDNLIFNNDEPPSSVQINGRVVDASGNGVAGVTVALNGSQTALTTTDANGNYVFGFVSTTGTHIVTPARNGLSFAPGSRTFVNPSWNQAATFVVPSMANPNPNASDATPFFVTQHYADFLNRDADSAGLNFWTNQIEACGADAACREVKRVNVSAAFYLSIEFQQTGFLAYRAAKASFGNLPGKPVPITLQQLMQDAQHISRNVVVNSGDWQAQLEANKVAYFSGYVRRPAFIARYPYDMPSAQFVSALLATAGLQSGEIDGNALINALNAGTLTRAQVVRSVSENAVFTQRETNRAFVLMQYFGYLRRNPDDAPDNNFDGYNFWLSKLDAFNGNFINAEMVKAFIASNEYRARSGQ